MRFNPISEKRLAYLTKYLQQKLEKSKRTQPWDNFSSQLTFLGSADPSPSGEYSRWIVDLMFVGDVLLPEDGEKLHELLSTFDRVKGRLPLEMRDIHRFRSYSQLRTTLLPMLPQLRSISELQSEGTELLASEHLNNALYQLYRLTTAEAASKAAQNTGWCVCDVDTAQSYLSEGPLYLITRNDKAFVLAHQQSGQVMNVDDEPLLPDNSEHHYQDIVQIFRKHLPQLLCKDHPNKPFSLFNLACGSSKCEKEGCVSCGFGFCSVKDCKNDENIRCPDHLFECTTCDEKICEDCVSTCCGDHFCPGDTQHCANCNRRDNTICDDCGTDVDCCDSKVCKKCVEGECSGCGNTYCKSCNNSNSTLLECSDSDCNKKACENCRDNWYFCDNCDHISCDRHLKICEGCEQTVCPDCDDQSCEFCKESRCRRCLNWCRDCKSEHCDRCEDSDCGVCDKHTHKVVLCDLCENETCDSCREDCTGCGRVACRDEQCHVDCEQCGYLCADCYLQDWCTVCNTHICYLEDHIQCAYVRRKRRRK